MRSTILGIHARLANQYPHIAIHLEKTREGEAMSELRWSGHRFVSLINFLIAWFGALPSNHGIALRSEKRGGSCWEIETSALTENADRARFAYTIHFITESDVIVRHLEGDRERHILAILQIHFQHIGIVSDITEFRAVHLILLMHFALFCFHETQSMSEITDVGLESKWRRIQHRLTIVIHRISGFATIHVHTHDQFAIRTTHLGCLSHGTEGKST